MKIRQKLVILPIFVSGILIISVFSLTLLQFNRITNNTLRENQRLLVSSMTQVVDEYINKYKEIMTSLRETDAVKDVSEYNNISDEYLGISDKEGVEARRLFKSTMALYPHITYINTFRKDGISVIIEPYEAQLEVKLDKYKRGFSYRDWYKGAMAIKDTYVSEAYVSASQFKPVIAVSTPIFNDEHIVGIMIGAVGLTELSEIVSSLSYGETGITYIVDKNGNLVAHPNEIYFLEKELTNLGDNEIVKLILASEDNLSKTFKVYDNLSAQEVYFCSQKVEVNDWYVVTQISASEATKEVRKLLAFIGAISVLCLSAIIVFMYRNAKKIVFPLESLSEISENVMKSDFSVATNDYRKLKHICMRTDEIGFLGKNYTLMINKLDKSYSELKDYNKLISEKKQQLEVSEKDLISKIKEINQQKKYIQFLANHDPLTGLPNRRKFQDKLNQALMNNNKGAVILLDLDNFKTINDTIGHLFGDQVLIKTADLFKSMEQDNIFTSRFGGDEFIILLKDVETKEEIIKVVKRIRALFRKPILIENRKTEINFSMGISRFPNNSINLSQLIMYADLALYSVKKSGRNSYQFFTDKMDKNIHYRTDIKNKLAYAINNNGFKVVYQPQVDIKTGEVLAYEALVRLKSYNISPGVFIEVAEENGQIIDIGRIVTKIVIQQLSKWKKEGHIIKPVAINFSFGQFRDNEYINILNHLMKKHQIPSEYIELEVTESIFVKETKDISIFFDKIKRLGIKIAMDDFGTGYSSLSYLTFIPIDKIKLDKALMDKFLKKDSVKIIDDIISLVHDFNLDIVAEGIEDYELLKYLMDVNCDAVQGYYFSQPLESNRVFSEKEISYKDKLK